MELSTTVGRSTARGNPSLLQLGALSVCFGFVLKISDRVRSLGSLAL
jgi:hypothetical protein